MIQKKYRALGNYPDILQNVTYEQETLLSTLADLPDLIEHYKGNEEYMKNMIQKKMQGTRKLSWYTLEYHTWIGNTAQHT